MKIETKVLQDGRLSISLLENDGSVLATRELSREDAINLFARWALVFLPTTGSSQVTLGGDNKDILIAVTDAKKAPLPEKETAADKKRPPKPEINPGEPIKTMY